MYRQRPRGFATKAIHQEFSLDDLSEMTLTSKDDANYCEERFQLEKKIADLDDGKFSLIFPSGLAAGTALFSLLKTGDHILILNNVYGGTDRIIRDFLTRYEIDNTFISDLSDVGLIPDSIRPNTKMVYFETPSNPLTRITDIEGLVNEVRKISSDIIIATDNTFLSPYFQKPLHLGVDIVLYSLTKYMNGHSDVIMGALVTNSKEYFNRLKKIQFCTGNYPSSIECDMVLKGIKSLKVRMDRIEKNSLELAEYLENHPKIEKVLHPSLPSHPQHKLALKQSYGFSGVFAFYIKNGTLENSVKLMESLKMVIGAASLGGTETLMQISVLTSHVMIPYEERMKMGITDNLLRISVGLEDVEDLIDDFAQALEIIGI
ncbi:CTH.2 family protein [Megaselia abdita]